eukprot:m.329791 g.329791  ORF g.329791 m.329791 type:complete len:370 (+) comp27713_c0_seq5:1754-2863(+)
MVRVVDQVTQGGRVARKHGGREVEGCRLVIVILLLGVQADGVLVVRPTPTVGDVHREPNPVVVGDDEPTFQWNSSEQPGATAVQHRYCRERACPFVWVANRGGQRRTPSIRLIVREPVRWWHIRVWTLAVGGVTVATGECGCSHHLPIPTPLPVEPASATRVEILIVRAGEHPVDPLPVKLGPTGENLAPGLTVAVPVNVGALEPEVAVVVVLCHSPTQPSLGDTLSSDCSLIVRRQFDWTTRHSGLPGRFNHRAVVRGDSTAARSPPVSHVACEPHRAPEPRHRVLTLKGIGDLALRTPSTIEGIGSGSAGAGVMSGRHLPRTRSTAQHRPRRCEQLVAHAHCAAVKTFSSNFSVSAYARAAPCPMFS